MDSSRKPRRRDRISSLFKKGKKPTQNADQSAIPITDSGPLVLFDDRQRTRVRYEESAKLLKKAIKGGGKWGAFDFPELNGKPEEFNDSQFRDKLDDAMNAQDKAIKDKEGWSKCRHIVQCVFTACSPLAKNFLTIAVNVQSIGVLNPYGLLAGGLLLLIQIADKETGRREELYKTLDFMSQLVQRIRIAQKLPDNIEEREAVINRAMDIRSACLLYLAANLPHDVVPLGDISRVFKTFVIGDEKLTDASVLLERTVATYDTAVNDAHMALTLYSVQVVEDLVKGGSLGAPQMIESNYIIPYQPNPKFTGRIKLLQKLKELLDSEAPKKFNHRVALFGMGGGWQNTMRPGVCLSQQDVLPANLLDLRSRPNLHSLGLSNHIRSSQLAPIRCNDLNENATNVLSWLSIQSSWLLILDNLDDMEVVKGLLPENGTGKHILLTTRNPRTEGIPAEPFEIPLLNVDDSLELLECLSTIPIDAGNKSEAEAVVTELGCLPLAIEQAAAYILQVTRDYSDYLIEYRKSRKSLLQWVPPGNRQYDYSVATAWSMSFQILSRTNRQATNLLRLFAFLSPDGIPIDFMTRGSGALDEELRHVVCNQVELAKVLLEVERFSLIKWHREAKSISIHRLVQTVIQDELSAKEAEKIAHELCGVFSVGLALHCSDFKVLDQQVVDRQLVGYIGHLLALAKSIANYQSLSESPRLRSAELGSATDSIIASMVPSLQNWWDDSRILLMNMYNDNKRM